MGRLEREPMYNEASEKNGWQAIMPDHRAGREAVS